MAQVGGAAAAGGGLLAFSLAWSLLPLQEAYNLTDRVLTVSLHKHAPGFYPGTGVPQACTVASLQGGREAELHVWVADVQPCC